jgi:5-methylcytosine-specific restriction protein A
MLSACLGCGTPATSTRCEQCAPEARREQQRRDDARRGSATARGYDAAWSRLSARARRLQPWCTDCQTTGTADNPLTADHLPGSWDKRAAGKRLTLSDVEVVCSRCNIARGATRGAHARSLGEGPGGPRGARTRSGRQSLGLIPPREAPAVTVGDR